MKRKIRYICEHCGLERANKLDMEKHEKLCKNITAMRLKIKKQFTGLYNHYKDLGYTISIVCNDYEIFVNVRYDKKI